MSTGIDSTRLPRRHVLAGLFGLHLSSNIRSNISPEEKLAQKWATKWGPSGPLLADDVTGTTDYAEWEASADNPYRKAS